MYRVMKKAYPYIFDIDKWRERISISDDSEIEIDSTSGPYDVLVLESAPESLSQECDPVDLFVWEIGEPNMRHATKIAEVITEAFQGVLITDRFSSYDSSLFDLVAQQKCLAHILKNLSELIKTKQGSAKVFASKLAELLRKMLDLWDRHRNGEISLEEYRKQGAILNKELDVQLRKRNLSDPNNDSMLNELGWHQDRGNLTRFLDDPAIDPTNNFAERLLRAAVIARKVSHCSKNERGANAYAAIKSVLTTLQLRGEPIIKSLAGLIAGARGCSAR